MRHKWEDKINNKIDENTKCLSCGIIKYSLGFIGGLIYFFLESDYYYDNKVPKCGVAKDENIEQYIRNKNTELFHFIERKLNKP